MYEIQLTVVICVIISVATSLRLYDRCTDHTQCPAHSTCRPYDCSGFSCLCDEGFVATDDKSKCLKARLVGEACSFDNTICMSPFAFCLGHCECMGVFQTTKDGRCKLPGMGFTGDKCDELSPCHPPAACVNNVCVCEYPYRPLTPTEFWVDPMHPRQCVTESYSLDKCNGTHVEVPLPLRPSSSSSSSSSSSTTTTTTASTSTTSTTSKVPPTTSTSPTSTTPTTTVAKTTSTTSTKHMTSQTTSTTPSTTSLTTTTPSTTSSPTTPSTSTTPSTISTSTTHKTTTTLKRTTTTYPLTTEADTTSMEATTLSTENFKQTTLQRELNPWGNFLNGEIETTTTQPIENLNLPVLNIRNLINSNALINTLSNKATNTNYTKTSVFSNQLAQDYTVSHANDEIKPSRTLSSPSSSLISSKELFSSSSKSVSSSSKTSVQLTTTTPVTTSSNSYELTSTVVADFHSIHLSLPEVSTTTKLSNIRSSSSYLQSLEINPSTTYTSIGSSVMQHEAEDVSNMEVVSLTTSTTEKTIRKPEPTTRKPEPKTAKTRSSIAITKLSLPDPPIFHIFSRESSRPSMIKDSLLILKDTPAMDKSQFLLNGPTTTNLPAVTTTGYKTNGNRFVIISTEVQNDHLKTTQASSDPQSHIFFSRQPIVPIAVTLFDIGRPLHSSCSHHKQCPEHATCRANACKGYTCLCDEGYIASEDKKFCLKAIRNGERCDPRTDKCLSKFSMCAGVCKCLEFFEHTRDGRCKLPDVGYVGDICVNGACSYPLKCVDGRCRCVDPFRELTTEEFWIAPQSTLQCRTKEYSLDKCNGSNIPVPVNLRPNTTTAVNQGKTVEDLFTTNFIQPSFKQMASNANYLISHANQDGNHMTTHLKSSRSFALRLSVASKDAHLQTSKVSAAGSNSKQFQITQLVPSFHTQLIDIPQHESGVNHMMSATLSLTNFNPGKSSLPLQQIYKSKLVSISNLQSSLVSLQNKRTFQSPNFEYDVHTPGYNSTTLSDSSVVFYMNDIRENSSIAISETFKEKPTLNVGTSYGSSNDVQEKNMDGVASYYLLAGIHAIVTNVFYSRNLDTHILQTSPAQVFSKREIQSSPVINSTVNVYPLPFANVNYSINLDVQKANTPLTSNGAILSNINKVSQYNADEMFMVTKRIQITASKSRSDINEKQDRPGSVDIYSSSISSEQHMLNNIEIKIGTPIIEDVLPTVVMSPIKPTEDNPFIKRFDHVSTYSHRPEFRSSIDRPELNKDRSTSILETVVTIPFSIQATPATLLTNVRTSLDESHINPTLILYSSEPTFFNIISETQSVNNIMNIGLTFSTTIDTILMRLHSSVLISTNLTTLTKSLKENQSFSTQRFDTQKNVTNISNIQQIEQSHPDLLYTNMYELDDSKPESSSMYIAKLATQTSVFSPSNIPIKPTPTLTFYNSYDFIDTQERKHLASFTFSGRPSDHKLWHRSNQHESKYTEADASSINLQSSTGVINGLLLNYSTMVSDTNRLENSLNGNILGLSTKYSVVPKLNFFRIISEESDDFVSFNNAQILKTHLEFSTSISNISTFVRPSRKYEHSPLSEFTDQPMVTKEYSIEHRGTPVTVINGLSSTAQITGKFIPLHPHVLTISTPPANNLVSSYPDLASPQMFAPSITYLEGSTMRFNINNQRTMYSPTEGLLSNIIIPLNAAVSTSKDITNEIFTNRPKTPPIKSKTDELFMQAHETTSSFSDQFIFSEIKPNAKTKVDSNNKTYRLDTGMSSKVAKHINMSYLPIPASIFSGNTENKIDKRVINGKNESLSSQSILFQKITKSQTVDLDDILTTINNVKEEIALRHLQLKLINNGISVKKVNTNPQLINSAIDTTEKSQKSPEPVLSSSEMVETYTKLERKFQPSAHALSKINLQVTQMDENELYSSRRDYRKPNIYQSMIKLRDQLLSSFVVREMYHTSYEPVTTPLFSVLSRDQTDIYGFQFTTTYKSIDNIDDTEVYFPSSTRNNIFSVFRVPSSDASAGVLKKSEAKSNLLKAITPSQATSFNTIQIRTQYSPLGRGEIVEDTTYNIDFSSTPHSNINPDMQEPDSPAERPSQVEEGGSGFDQLILPLSIVGVFLVNVIAAVIVLICRRKRRSDLLRSRVDDKTKKFTEENHSKSRFRIPRPTVYPPDYSNIVDNSSSDSSTYYNYINTGFSSFHDENNIYEEVDKKVPVLIGTL